MHGRAEQSGWAVGMKPNPEHLCSILRRLTLRAQQERTFDLAGEKTSRLPIPCLIVKSFERIAEIEDQFRAAVGDYALWQAMVVAVIFENPKSIDDRSQVDGGCNFPVPQHLSSISHPTAKSGSV
jgi:hypothetical protein